MKSIYSRPQDGLFAIDDLRLLQEESMLVQDILKWLYELEERLSSLEGQLSEVVDPHAVPRETITTRERVYENDRTKKAQRPRPTPPRNRSGKVERRTDEL